MKVQEKKSQKYHIRWMLVCYDALIYLMSAILLLILYGGMDKLTTAGIAEQMIISAICILFVRMIGKIYNQVWRYGGNPMLYETDIYRWNSICVIFGT